MSILYIEYDKSITDFINFIKEFLDLAESVIHTSCHYIDNIYYQYKVLGLKIKVYVADNEKFKKTGFTISILPQKFGIVTYKFIDDLGDYLARLFVLNGYYVVRSLINSVEKEDIHEIMYEYVLDDKREIKIRKL